MLAIYFNSDALRRDMTRNEWRELWRWKRVTQKKIATEVQRQIADFGTFGTTHPAWSDFLDRLINPPLLVHPEFGRLQ